ncbi:NAD-dependent epimerase/dehydratase family protein [Halobacteria archaeon AArc-dxtr1]|nr:NAD-dependent epimerase/dehydratase family protein [Halobacteria archaeon AArc-dxtr1]
MHSGGVTVTRTAAVTGATGFLGTTLCEQLLADGWEVRGLCRERSDRSPLGEAVEWHVGDIAEGDAEPIRELVDGADAVFHLAGIGLWSADDETVEQVNVEGTRRVLGACADADAGRLVFTSTAGTRRPSESGGVADETDLAPPVGAYQRSKARAEVLVDEYAETAGEAVTVHPTSIFGPGDETFTGGLLAMATEPTMPIHLPGGVSIVGVSDVVDGILAAYEEGENGEHYILGGENLRFDRAVSRIADQTGGSPARIRVPATAIHAAGPVAEVVGSATGRRVFPFDSEMARLSTEPLFYTSEKAHDKLGYTYEPIEAHVPDAMAWYRSQ